MKAADGAVTFGLQSVLAALGSELLAAEDRAAGEGFGLVIQEAEVELAFNVQEKTSGGGKLSINVFGFGGVGGGVSRDKSDSTVHRIKLRLAPRPDRTSTAVAGGRERMDEDNG